MSTSSPISPRLVKGGLVTMDPTTSTVKTVIALQYNPDSLARTLQIQSLPGGTDGVRVDALRLRGGHHALAELAEPPHEEEILQRLAKQIAA